MPFTYEAAGGDGSGKNTAGSRAPPDAPLPQLLAGAAAPTRQRAMSSVRSMASRMRGAPYLADMTKQTTPQRTSKIHSTRSALLD